MLKELLGAAFLVWPLVLVLLILLAFVLAIGVSVFFASRKGRGKWRWAFVGFLVVYVPIFWDWIPTVMAHKYYCEKDAGFWVYKTFDEWKAENPGVLEQLPAPSPTGSPTNYDRFDDGFGETFTYLLNDRFSWIITQQDISRLLPITRTEQQLVDVKRKDVLARYVSFATSDSVKTPIDPPGPLKFWIRRQKCIGSDGHKDNFRKFRDHFYGSKK